MTNHNLETDPNTESDSRLDSDTQPQAGSGINGAEGATFPSLKNNSPDGEEVWSDSTKSKIANQTNNTMKEKEAGENIPNEKENGSTHPTKEEKSHSREENLQGEGNHGDGPGQPANGRNPDQDGSGEERASRQSLGSENQHPEPVPGDIESGDAILEEHTERAPSKKNSFSLDQLSSSDQWLESKAVSAAPPTAGAFDVGKPSNDKFVRTSRDPEHWRFFDLIEADDQVFIVTPKTVAQIHALHEKEGQMVIALKRARFVLTVEKTGRAFLWRIGDPDSDNSWVKSATNAATDAKDSWVRLVPNHNAKRYDYRKGKTRQKPVFPPETYEELLNLAFEERIIDSMNHEVIENLLG